MNLTHSTDGSTFEEKVIACLDTYFEHKEEKEEKKNNLVIYGLPESENPDIKVRQAEDREAVDSIIEKSGLDVSVISEVFRMPKRTGSKFPALVKVKLNSREAKKAVMSNQKEVIAQTPQMESGKGKFSQYFRHDLTYRERQYYSGLVKQRNDKNANLRPGEPKWKVYKMTLSQPPVVRNSGN